MSAVWPPPRSTGAPGSGKQGGKRAANTPPSAASRAGSSARRTATRHRASSDSNTRRSALCVAESSARIPAAGATANGTHLAVSYSAGADWTPRVWTAPLDDVEAALVAVAPRLDDLLVAPSVCPCTSPFFIITLFM